VGRNDCLSDLQPLRQGFQLSAIVDRMNARFSSLEPVNVDRPPFKVYIAQLESTSFRHAKPVANHKEKQAMIAFGITRGVFLFDSSQKLLDLFLG
jgi:hypothetical protein